MPVPLFLVVFRCQKNRTAKRHLDCCCSSGDNNHDVAFRKEKSPLCVLTFIITRLYSLAIINRQKLSLKKQNSPLNSLPISDRLCFPGFALRGNFSAKHKIAENSAFYPHTQWQIGLPLHKHLVQLESERQKGGPDCPFLEVSLSLKWKEFGPK